MKYDIPGEYEIKYTATDDCGNTATQTRFVTVQGVEYRVLLDLTNYTAPSGTPLEKPNSWIFDDGINLVVEAEGVTADGRPTEVVGAYFDGFTTNPSIAVSLNQSEYIEDGAGVWFMSSDSDTSEFVSSINSEGAGEVLPSVVFFEKLVIKQEINQ